MAYLSGNPGQDVEAIAVALEVTEGYWERAGLLRAHLLGQGQKARLADTLIAQSCLDHDVALVTRDRDFRHFAGATGLRLLPPLAER